MTTATTGAETVPAVSFDGVSIARGGRTIWSQGTFKIAPGSVIGVIGPNGSGKTTMLEMILGLQQPTSGTIEVLGSRPHRGNDRIGYVPQNYTSAISEMVRCRDLVAMGIWGTKWGIGRKDKDATLCIEAELAAVGALDIADRRLSKVSGGQQQRVAIAQALVNHPEILLLDEPLANLDVRNQQDVVHLIEHLNSSEESEVAQDDCEIDERHTDQLITTFIVAHDLNPLLSVLTGAIYLLDGHAHYDEIGNVVDEHLLSHLYGTAIKVVRTPQGDLFTRNA